MLLSSACRTQAPVGAEAPREMVTQEPSVVGHVPPQVAERNDAGPPTPAPAPVLPPFPEVPEPTHADSRCPPGMTFVPGGRWTKTQLKRMTKAALGHAAYGLRVAPTVPDFCLDLTEVTFGAVARCIARGACPMLELDPNAKRATQVNRLNSLLDGSDLEAWKQAWGTGANLPISGTLPREVIELCGGLGGRAPTVEEWLWAAWGGREDRLYPWGGAPLDATRLNLKEHARVRSGDDDVVDHDGFNAAAPVGSYPRGAGRWGHLDLAGNLSETVFPTLGRERMNVDRSEFCECGLDYTYEDETAPASVHNFALCMRDPSNESCSEHTFRDWRLFPCVGPGNAGGGGPDTSNGFRCAADPAQAVKER